MAMSLVAMLTAAAQVGAQAPPPKEQPPPPEKKGILKPYQFRPNLYWGAGLGLDIMPLPKTLCPGGVNGACIGMPLGFGFEFHMGARPHYLVAIDLMYDAFFFPEEKSAYNQATLQSIHAGVRFYVLAGANIEAYLLAGGGVNFFGDRYSVQSTGGGFRAGAGVEFVPSPAFSVGVVAQYKGTYFPQHEAKIDVDDSTVEGAFLHGIDVMLNLAFHYVLVR
jgi:hypothetical protein